MGTSHKTTYQGIALSGGHTITNRSSLFAQTVALIEVLQKQVALNWKRKRTSNLTEINHTLP